MPTVEANITHRVTDLVESLIATPGCGALTAGELIGEATDIPDSRPETPTPCRQESPPSPSGQPTATGTGSTTREALRTLKRKLANVVYRTLHVDTPTTQLKQAA